MKILLIEDNIEISENIKKYLELDWYKIDCFYDWILWLDEALIKKYDLILLDLMLPWIDGLTISRKLNWKITTPIIIISAKEDIETKLKWFEYWVIDYIDNIEIINENLDNINLEENESSNISWDNYSTYKDYDKSLLSDEKNNILQFHADWCPSCVSLEKELNNSNIPSNLNILKVDYDNETELRKNIL